MDLNQMLLWIVAVSSIVGLVQLARTRALAARGWLIVSASLLAVTAAAYFAFPQIAGYISGATWGILVLVPSLGSRVAHRLVMQQRYEQARTLTMVLRWLHPADGWIEQPEICRALGLAEAGEIERASEILNRYRTRKSPATSTATAIYFRINHRWDEFLEWVGRADSPLLLRDPNLLVTYVRALGETGNLNSMLRTLALYEKDLGSIALATHRAICSMMAFAFCGNREGVERLCNGKLRAYPEDVKQFWLGTAEIASGNVETGNARLRTIAGMGNRLIGIAVEKRFSRDLADPAMILTPQSRDTLSRYQTEISHEEQFGEQAGRTCFRPYVVLLLIALNVVAFLIEMARGGSTNFETLYRLGTLDVGAVWNGEWFRTVTSTFLHFGALHLVMNMFGLYFLGPFLEFSLGARRFLAVYLVSGIGSMLAIVFFAKAGLNSESSIYLGASGSITGLVGGTAAVLLRHWRNQKSMVLKRRLFTITLVMCMQVAFDLFTPEISFTAHAVGALIGFSTLLLAFPVVVVRSEN